MPDDPQQSDAEDPKKPKPGAPAEGPSPAASDTTRPRPISGPTPEPGDTTKPRPNSMQRMLDNAGFPVPFQMNPSQIQLEINGMSGQSPDQQPQQPRHPQIPAADPTTQRETEDFLKMMFRTDAVKDGSNVQEMTGRQARDLQAIMDGVYAKLSVAVPDAQYLPPKPKLYSLDAKSSIVAMYFLENRPGVKADAFISAPAALKSLTKAEEEAIVAHEVAHATIKANQDTPIPFVPPNTKALRDDLKRLGIPDDTSDKRYRQYMNEMQSDILAVQITRNPEALISAFGKIGNIYDQVIKDLADTKIADRQAQADHLLTEAEKDRIRTDTRKKADDRNNQDNPHPSDAVRAEIVRITELELEKRDRAAAARGQGVEQHGVPTRAPYTPAPGNNTMSVGGGRIH